MRNKSGLLFVFACMTLIQTACGNIPETKSRVPVIYKSSYCSEFAASPETSDANVTVAQEPSNEDTAASKFGLTAISG